ncbi:hypothetical protein GCM10012280_40210 [Wenjunlia tyrosinilytica]|uniref:Uncharacterized protein n=1 Tax=Wenjunlia tyrosinilytica TaxID=1544741 RepID=A0A918E007_9ACTN|nr:hypothetical protein GCM10012280_40210 [Wenjunlia tyrosinilytica]
MVRVVRDMCSPVGTWNRGRGLRHVRVALFLGGPAAQNGEPAPRACGELGDRGVLLLAGT